MDQDNPISRAKILLTAVHCVCNGNVEHLHNIAAKHPNILSYELALRLILTYLPGATDPKCYTSLLQQLRKPSLGDDVPTGVVVPEKELGESDDDSLHRVQNLALRSLEAPPSPFQYFVDPLSRFLYHQSHRIAEETGSLTSVYLLLKSFLGETWYLRNWIHSIIVPLIQLQCRGYVRSHEREIQIKDLEEKSAGNALSTLLESTLDIASGADGASLGNLLRDVVAPFLLGFAERALRIGTADKSAGSSTSSVILVQDDFVSLQHRVNEWLLDLVASNPKIALEAIDEWGGPEDAGFPDWAQELARVDVGFSAISKDRYAQAVMAMLYLLPKDYVNDADSWRILGRAAQLSGVKQPIHPKVTPNVRAPENLVPYIQSLKQTDLLRHELLRSNNTFTTSRYGSLVFANFCCLSTQVLRDFDLESSIQYAAQLVILASKADQHRELMRILNRLLGKPRQDQYWATARLKILWLQSWHANVLEESATPIRLGLFGLLDKIEIESELLRAMLLNGSYQHARNQYCNENSETLTLKQVEQLVHDVVIFTFDSASNGNKTRGEVRKASEIVSTFHSVFPASQQLQEAEALIAAAHSMSFYSLTLEHGVPFRPVNIRAHSDPLSLIDIILKQNPRSYAKLDDLIQIGLNIVKALPAARFGHAETANENDFDPEAVQMQAQRRVSAMAVQAALDEEDFDTAYTYMVTRLDRYGLQPSVHVDESTRSQREDDISWRIAYQAGCHVSAAREGEDVLRRLEQRMELLSMALHLAPPSAMTEILDVWRQCETEMMVQVAQEKEEQEAWDAKADREVPGGFDVPTEEYQSKSRRSVRPTLGEEAPIGLFDVARGAASAFRKSAFPLGQGQLLQNKAFGKSASGAASSDGANRAVDEETREGHRVRKRDMVGNMVTGGLASGLGWVLGTYRFNHFRVLQLTPVKGAPPVQHDHG